MVGIIVTNHAKYRMLERGIDIHEAKKIVKSGKVTKTDSDGTITKIGLCSNNKNLVVVSVRQENEIIIKTAYYEN